MDMDLTSSLSFQTHEDSNEFKDLQELFNNCKVQDLPNSLYEFPNLDDICLQPQINNDSTEILQPSNVDFPLYDYDHKLNQYNSIEATQNLTRVSSFSLNSPMVMHPIEPLSNVFPASTSFSTNIPDYSRLLNTEGASLDVKYSMGKKIEGRNQRKSNVVRGQWTVEEDRLLTQLVEQYGLGKWAQKAQFLKGKIGKQCRERWHNHLRPNIKKDSWTEEEDRILINAHIGIGNRWTEIARKLPGRTESSIKNRWNATKRKLFSRKRSRALKYHKSGSLLQNYLISLGRTQANQATIYFKNNSLQPLTSTNSLLPLTGMNSLQPHTCLNSLQPLTSFNNLKPLINFNNMNDFHTGPMVFNQHHYAENMNGFGRRDGYGVKMEWDTNTLGFGNGKMEMDLVEMMNYINKPRFNSNSFSSF